MKPNLRSLVLASFALAASLSNLPAGPADGRTIDITGNDTLHYSVSRIDATPGEILHIVLKNMGTVPKEAMAHNWVLLVPGETADAYAAAAVTAATSNYMPAALKSDVLASIPLLGPGETGEVTFKAPTTPGTYSYLCSFPAHCAAGMRGVLVVK